MKPDSFLTIGTPPVRENRHSWKETLGIQRVPTERATGLEPATSSLEGWRSTN